jgi:amino acid transporter
MSAEGDSGSTVSNFLRSFKVVAWSFIGIRKQSEFHMEGNSVKPVQVIVVGLLLALLFVLGLLTVINLVV